MANPWNTIHIFGFGTVQVITDTQNVQAPISTVLEEVNAVVNDVWSKKPEGYEGSKNYHAINNFYQLFSDWLPGDTSSKSFRVQAADLDQSLLNDLASKVLAYNPETV